MPDDIRFRIDGSEYTLAESIAAILSEKLIAYDPDGDDSPRRSMASSIERCLVDPETRPIEPNQDELYALEHTLDHMASGRNREVCILYRAVREALGGLNGRSYSSD